MTKTALTFIAIYLGTWALLAGAAEPKRAGVSFSSAVNWEFEKHEKLDAWRNTALVIRKTLAEWYPPAVSGGALENSTRAELRSFLANLPATESGSLSIVYLASHQTRGGRWLSPNGAEHLWSEILIGTATRPRSPRVLIVDACHAEAADATTLGRGLVASGILYTGRQAEVVHELNFFRRFPIDLPRRHPTETGWLRNKLGEKWNGRVSFFGFIWLQSFMATAEAPRSASDWEAFFRRCEGFGRKFGEGRGASMATTLRYVSTPGGPP